MNTEQNKLNRNLIALIVAAFVLGIIVGLCISVIPLTDKKEEHPIKYYDDGADTIQVIINNKGWEITHPYKKKGE
jgi:hypothetical protein